MDNEPTQAVALRDKLGQQHPLHGMMADVFEELGGEEFLLTWAEENQTEFIKMFMKLAPPAIPKGASGGIHLHIHSDLQPTALDVGQGSGITIENEG